MPVSFDGRVSIGQLLTFAGMFAAILGSWFNLNGNLTRAQQDIAAYQSQLSAYENRIRAVELAQASQSSDLRNIQIGISEIKASISQIVRTPLTSIPEMPRGR